MNRGEAQGGYVKVKPGNTWYAQAGSYLVYQDFRNKSHHGVEFGAPKGSGALTLGEVGYVLSAEPGQPLTRPPATYKVGGYHDGETLPEIATGKPVKGTWGVYVLGEQMIYAENAAFTEGLSAFLALSYAPPERNLITFMVTGGLSYVGLIPGRDKDGLAFIVANAGYSQDAPNRDFELLLELNYRVAVAPWFFFQPDIQGIVHPNGYRTIADALVVGFGAGIML